MWNDGYVSDLGYTFGYYTELNPLHMSFALACAGYECRQVEHACELGFGQGVSVNIHSAASSVSWRGNDFSPSQVAFARSMAGTTKLRENLFETSFSDFSNGVSHPDYDMIGLHGVWSWVSEEAREAIVNFINSYLAPGGVVYISYNTLPGWASFAPIRQLMSQYATTMVPPAHGTDERVSIALRLTKELLDACPIYNETHPTVINRLATVEKQPRNYLAHEYFNRDWQPMYFDDVARKLRHAKLDFACSANLLDSIDAINISERQAALLQGIPDPYLKQAARDFFVNQQFRKDYWIRGLRPLTKKAQAATLRGFRLILIRPASGLNYNIMGPLGQATLARKVYDPIIRELANHRVHGLEALTNTLESQGLSFPEVIQAIQVLIGSGQVLLCQSKLQEEESQSKAAELNLRILKRLEYSSDISCLASPVTGGGIPVGRIEQLFLLAMAQGETTAETWAGKASKILASNSESLLLKDGRSLEDERSIRRELITMAEKFIEETLPILMTLRVLPLK
jgi:SAM-dependent methyltransferase